MSKLEKQLKYRNHSIVYGVNLYSKKEEVGINYIPLRIDGSIAYVQIGNAKDKGNSHLNSRLNDENGNPLKVKSSSQDFNMLNDMSNSFSKYASPSIPSIATYDCSGQNVTKTYTGNIVMPAMKSSQLIFIINATITNNIILDETSAYKLYYGYSISDINIDAGAFINGEKVIEMQAIHNPIFFKAVAININNEILYESAIYCFKVPDFNVNEIYQKLKIMDSNGDFESIKYNDTGEKTGSINWSMGFTNNYRYYKTGVYTSKIGDKYSDMLCADTCNCNCNYCTCNCNYCTCNCNYCTCDCNFCADSG